MKNYYRQEILLSLEKLAAESEKKKTYPVSRALTSDATSKYLGGAVGSAQGAMMGGVGGYLAGARKSGKLGKGLAALGGLLGAGAGGYAGSEIARAANRGRRREASVGREAYPVMKRSITRYNPSRIIEQRALAGRRATGKGLFSWEDEKSSKNVAKEYRKVLEKKRAGKPLTKDEQKLRSSLMGDPRIREALFAGRVATGLPLDFLRAIMQGVNTPKN